MGLLCHCPQTGSISSHIPLEAGQQPFLGEPGHPSSAIRSSGVLWSAAGIFPASSFVGIRVWRGVISCLPEQQLQHWQCPQVDSGIYSPRPGATPSPLSGVPWHPRQCSLRHSSSSSCGKGVSVEGSDFSIPEFVRHLPS